MGILTVKSAELAEMARREIGALCGAARALAGHRIGLIQIEWNEMFAFAVGAYRRPLAELLAGHGG
jgi:hypothetical protein